MVRTRVDIASLHCQTKISVPQERRELIYTTKSDRIDQVLDSTPMSLAEASGK